MKNSFKLLKCRYLIILIVILRIILFNNISMAQDSSELKKTVVYFSSSTCSSCAKVSEYISNLEIKYDINIIRYNINTKQNKKIFNAYCNKYGVSQQDSYVPIIFIGNKYLLGKQIILNDLEYEIISKDVDNALLVQSDDGNFDNDVNIFNSMKWVSVFVAGIINGINPCSLAMFIFLLSLCLMNKEKIIKIATTYIIGKFITFLFLGTILYKVLTYINFSIMNIITKVFSIIIIFILVIYNLLDSIESKHNRYNNMKLQLPLGVRKFNHTIMKKIENAMEKKYLLLVVLFISVVVSLGEFMCTGQIYLITLVTVIKYLEDFNFKAVCFLIIYNIALVLPIFLVSIIINKGENIFHISEFVREKIPMIKIINVIILLVVAIFIIIS